MTNEGDRGTTTVLTRKKFGTILFSDPIIVTDNNHEDDNEPHRRSNASDPPPSSGNTTPYYFMSPLIHSSPFTKSPWMHHEPFDNDDRYGLIGSLVREEGHVYSLAASGDLLYTGSDSKNIRVWKNLQEFSGFKSNSGLVKAIVTFGDKVFTGHQDGKIRVWKFSGKKQRGYKRIGSLPTIKDYLKTSINPKNYVEVRRHHVQPWIKHFDAVSCMSVDVNQGLLYSGSWDKSFKVWRISDSKCLESVQGHDDAVNSIAVGFDGLVFTGSADGTVKAWRRELVGNQNHHILVETLLKQDFAVTSLAVNVEAAAVYAGSSDGLVNCWEREKHFISRGGVLRGHKMAVLCLAAGGNLVLSGSADKSICVWRREEECGVHTCLSVLTGHAGPIKCLAMEQEEESSTADRRGDDQRWIVYSGSLDKSVKVWNVSEYAPELQSVEQTPHRMWC